MKVWEEMWLVSKGQWVSPLNYGVICSLKILTVDVFILYDGILCISILDTYVFFRAKN